MRHRTASLERRRRPRSVAAPLFALAGLTLTGSVLPGTALAHEGDPKLRDRQPMYEGAGWTVGSTRRAAGNQGLVASGIQFPASGVQLLSWLSLSDFGTGATSGNDSWGYTSPSGREYALMGLSNATAFVEITDPSNAQIVTTISGVESLWRDIKTYGPYAYAVSEGGGGIQVFDLTAIDAGVVTELASVTTGVGTSASHNVAIDTVSGFLYRCGGGSEGLRIYSLANPAAPTYVGEWGDRYVHDAQIVTYTSGPFAGRQIAFVCGGFNGGFTETSMDVLDVTDKNNIVVLKRVFWSGAAYSHQCWLSEDGQLLYVNDELDENGSFNTKTIVVDVSNPANAFYVTSFFGTNTAVGHNLYTSNGRIYEANYRSGMRIFDTAANPTNPPEVAFFDTYPEDDAASTSALWNVYPYFEDDIVIGSDLEKGLFVWYVGAPKVSFEFPSGLPQLFDPAGETIQVRVLEASAGALQGGSAQLFFDYGNGYQSVPLTPLGGDLFEASLPSLPCGAALEFYVSATSTDGLVWNAPDLGSNLPYRAPIGTGETLVASFDMESGAGWTSGAAGDDATTGIWTRVDPVGTEAAPEDDHSAAGTQAWITGQGSPGGSVGTDDIDGGKTTLLSPVLDLAGIAGAQVRYWRWYSNGFNGVKDDVLDVDISNDGGSSWVPVERLGPAGPGTDGGWVPYSFAVAQYVLPTNQVRLRFVARDTGGGSIVEAGLDDFTVVDLGCADCDGSGKSDGIEVLLGATADIDADFVPDLCEPLVGAPSVISLASGGNHALSLHAGAAFAGDTYIVLGSLSGTAPGVAIDGVVLPLNPDAYTTATLTGALAPLFVGTFGQLDGSGAASASIVLNAGLDPSLAGLVLDHAYPVLDTASLTVVFASNAVSLELAP
ncbi:choice-of-anchor B family protein [Engelhardtia mirabilis]|uniref:MAM domain-containing protein n=1 Tax=Engelhardtia mirabilis TaxID=2528011 RepID=A0A518BSA1_9BACT|nr:hypothetical protein Pla133_49690 [Planctomycetes bacterium Pla133]QDV04172.1 hypothetical protein Pla86_49670 [Planctomycetes bacterium Pla86]